MNAAAAAVSTAGDASASICTSTPSTSEDIRTSPPPDDRRDPPPAAVSSAAAAARSGVGGGVGSSAGGSAAASFGSALAAARRTCALESFAHLTTAISTMGWMIGSRIDDITRSADARMSWLPFSRSRWNELTESSARSGCSPAYRTRYMYTSFLSSMLAAATFLTTSEKKVDASRPRYASASTDFIPATLSVGNFESSIFLMSSGEPSSSRKWPSRPRPTLSAETLKEEASATLDMVTWSADEGTNCAAQRGAVAT